MVKTNPTVKDIIEDLLLTGDYVITDTNGHVVDEYTARHGYLKGFNEVGFLFPVLFEDVPNKIIGIYDEDFDGLIPTQVIYGKDEDPLYFVWE